MRPTLHPVLVVVSVLAVTAATASSSNGSVYQPDVPRMCVVELDMHGHGRLREFHPTNQTLGRVRVQTPQLTYGTVDVSSSGNATIWMTSHGFLVIPHRRKAPYDAWLVSGEQCFAPPHHVVLAAVFNATEQAFYALVGHDDTQPVTLNRLVDQQHLSSCAFDQRPARQLTETRLDSAASWIDGDRLLHAVTLTATQSLSQLSFSALSRGKQVIALPHADWVIQAIRHDPRRQRSLLIIGTYDDHQHNVVSRIVSVADGDDASVQVVQSSFPRMGWLRFALVDHEHSVIVLGFEDRFVNFSRSTIVYVIDLVTDAILSHHEFDVRLYAGHWCPS